MSEFDNRTTYTIKCDDNIGEVKIADEVISVIAGLAATEVDGVASLAGNITNETISKLNAKGLSKGVKVTVVASNVKVELSLNLKQGYSIPDTSVKVQEKVKSAIENMTGLTVLDINVRISGVTFDK